MRDRIGLQARRVPEFPILDGDGRGAATAVEIVRGPFRIISSAAHQRIRIEHSDRFETVTVDATARVLRGDVPVETVPGGPGDASSWVVPLWGATVRLRPTRAGLRVELQCEGYSAEVSLPKPKEPGQTSRDAGEVSRPRTRARSRRADV